jgi:hypothetical protein
LIEAPKKHSPEPHFVFKGFGKKHPLREHIDAWRGGGLLPERVLEIFGNHHIAKDTYLGRPKYIITCKKEPPKEYYHRQYVNLTVVGELSSKGKQLLEFLIRSRKKAKGFRITRNGFLVFEINGRKFRVQDQFLFRGKETDYRNDALIELGSSRPELTAVPLKFLESLDGTGLWHNVEAFLKAKREAEEWARNADIGLTGYYSHAARVNPQLIKEYLKWFQEDMRVLPKKVQEFLKKKFMEYKR